MKQHQINVRLKKTLMIAMHINLNNYINFPVAKQWRRRSTIAQECKKNKK